MTKITENMEWDDWQKAWFDLAKEKGHVLKADDDGSIDTFVTSQNHHNGPGCTKCGWSECMHCDFTGEKIPVCKGS